MKKTLLIFLIVTVYSLSNNFVYSQGCPGTYPEVCSSLCAGCVNVQDCLQCIDDNPDAGVPIDGGLSWLLLSGIGLATGRYIRKKKKNK